MGRGQELARRLAAQHIAGAAGGEAIGRVGLAALELLDLQLAGKARDVLPHPGRERALLEAVLVAHRHRAGEFLGDAHPGIPPVFPSGSRLARPCAAVPLHRGLTFATFFGNAKWKNRGCVLVVSFTFERSGFGRARPRPPKALRRQAFSLVPARQATLPRAPAITVSCSRRISRLGAKSRGFPESPSAIGENMANGSLIIAVENRHMELRGLELAFLWRRGGA